MIDASNTRCQLAVFPPTSIEQQVLLLEHPFNHVFETLVTDITGLPYTCPEGDKFINNK